MVTSLLLSVVAAVAGLTAPPTTPPNTIKYLDFHGTHILASMVGDVSCGRPGQRLGPFGEPAVVFVNVDAVEHASPRSAPRGIRIIVRADDRSIIDTGGKPEAVPGEGITSIETDERFFLPLGVAVSLQSSVCPTGGLKGRNIASHVHLIAIAAPGP